jgi:hypothetical protein
MATDWYARLGAALEEGWAARGRDEEEFADVAAGVLERLPAAQHFDREALLHQLMDPARTAVAQLAPLGAFGQPGFTIHHGDGFVIEIYYWLESMSAIHNHPFCGVFTVLEGFSVHARYEVELRRRVGSRAWLADAPLRGLELVPAGHIERFSLRRHPLVHALVHVPVPTISMVLRTERTEGYLRYLPPTLALPMEQPPDPSGRRLALLESLRHAGDPAFAGHLEALLQRADFETAVRVISDLWPSQDAGARAAIVESLRPRHGDAVDAIAPAMDRAQRMLQATAVREASRDPRHRLVATTLAYAERRDDVLRVLSSPIDGAASDPLATLHAFVDAAGLFGPDEEASAVVAHALVDGEGHEGAWRRLVARWGESAVAPHAEPVADFCAQSMFSALARA